MASAKQIRVLHYGMGHIGAEVASLVARRPDMVSVAAVDVDTAKVGSDLGTLLGDDPWGITVRSSLRAALEDSEADIAIHTTGSFLPQVQDQLLELIGAKLNICSTCEELCYPALKHPGLASDLDERAKANGVTVHATGVNPGFVMDAFALAVSGVCQEVRGVRVERIVDASKRRPPLQIKTGAGLSPEAFMAQAETGSVRHAGYQESVALIAAGLGWQLDRVEETIRPIVATEAVATDVLSVKPGQALGLHQEARGFIGKNPVIEMVLEMRVDRPDGYDRVVIDGIPPLDVKIMGGTHGDRATVARVVNSLLVVVAAPPGLATVLDLPIAPGWGTCPEADASE
jgi:4-hydroxy-tetrahydrodipicolinate reductase